MRKHLWRGGITVVLVLLVTAVTAPAPAQAAKQTWPDIRMRLGALPNGIPAMVASVTGPLFVGDCEMRNARVELTKADAAGRSVVIWTSDELRTHHTSNYDVWWQSFRFKTAFGTVVGGMAPLPGPKMYDAHEPYSVEQKTSIAIDPEIWPLIKRVEWTGEC